MSTDLWEGMDIGYKRETITFEDGSSKEMDVIDPESVSRADYEQMMHRAIKIGELEMRWEAERLAREARPIEERLAEAQAEVPTYVDRWLREWNVPESEWEKWQNYVIEVVTTDKVGGGRYYSGRKTVEIGLGQQTRPSLIAHELAHANYYEELPEEMGGGERGKNIWYEDGSVRVEYQGWYAKAHEYAQKISPAYKAALATYGVGTEREGLAYFPTEGYATAYGNRKDEWDVNTKLPWFLEPFYGNLLYPVEDLPTDHEKAALVWIISYMKDRLSQDMTDEEAKLAFSQMAMYTPREAFEGFPKDIWK